MSLPLALILLVIVFATGVAALLCLGVGVFAVLGGVGAALALAHAIDISTYAVNVVTLVGLGIAIDYSLFIVTRFREELASGQSVEDALGTTMATAGRAIMFSGLTVAIGLSGLLFYTGTALVSMGVAGAIVVAISVLYAVTLLPAMLASSRTAHQQHPRSHPAAQAVRPGRVAPPRDLGHAPAVDGTDPDGRDPPRRGIAVSQPATRQQRCQPAAAFG